ncbi:SDR family NAD(P)-dependent oxidoreductase [Sediminivirga luteola]|uniref:SDR family NAD(P)-dependent oxidoreductase n=1 Tax=Sediminivirga luteola TaxID=1774748 RepID=UPI001F5ACC55|nr:SDR family oxidoreductase [Sediminivirga luteola]
MTGSERFDAVGGAEQSGAVGGAAVVSGASGVLGTAIVRRLQREGRYVIGVDLRPESEADAHVPGDTGVAETWQRVAAALEERNSAAPGHGEPGEGRARGRSEPEEETAPGQAGATTASDPVALVIAAGAGGRSSVLDCTEEEWDRLLRANLTSTWLGIKHCAPALPPGSSIVTIGSIYGQNPPPGPPNIPSSPAYQAAKAGIEALTRLTASELAPRGIRVNCLAPGLFRTGITDDLSPEQFSARLSPAALGRPGEPAEVAGAVAFLVSGEATYITGSVLNVDGGYLLRL